jgi:hypothetical protein
MDHQIVRAVQALSVPKAYRFTQHAARTGGTRPYSMARHAREAGR